MLPSNSAHKDILVVQARFSRSDAPLGRCYIIPTIVFLDFVQTGMATRRRQI